MAEGEATHDLAGRAAAGDSIALKLLLTEHHGALCKYVERRMPGYLAGVVGVEDVVQDAYLDTFRSIRSFRSVGPNSFYRWLVTLALNRLRKAIRHHRATRFLRVPAVRQRGGESTWCTMHDVMTLSPSPSRVMARDEAADALEGALADLPERYRTAIGLVRIAGLSFKDAAERMGCTERVVHGLWRRGREMLRERLGGDDRVYFLTSP